MCQSHIWEGAGGGGGGQFVHFLGLCVSGRELIENISSV